MDEEVVKLLKKVVFAVFIALVVVAPLIFYVYMKFDNGTSDLLSKINNDENVLIFITSNKCSSCDKIETVLKEDNVSYIKINKDKDNSNYKIVLNKIKLDEKYAPAPSLIYVENGELNTYIYEFDEVNLEEFFNEKKLIKE